MQFTAGFLRKQISEFVKKIVIVVKDIISLEHIDKLQKLKTETDD